MTVDVSSETQEYLQAVRRFVRTELLPHEDFVEEHDHLPPGVEERIRRRAVAMGLTGMAFPVEVGGTGMSLTEQVLVTEELFWALPGLAEAVPAPPDILLACDEAQREKYLFPSIAGEKQFCFALTEPDSGSDAGGITTRATRDGDEWVINGTKRFISHGETADFAIVFAVTDPDSTSRRVTAFLVDRGTPGFQVGQRHRTMGQRGYHQCELVFDDCRVGDGQVMGGVGEGFGVVFDGTRGQRIITAARCLGPMARLIGEGLDWAKQRVQFGQPIAQFQAIQFMLADCAVDLYASRMVTYGAAAAVDAGQDAKSVNVKAATAKLFASEAVGRVADRVLQIFGGTGWMNETYVERAYRNARVERIWEGTSEIQRLIIARSLLKRGMFA